MASQVYNPLFFYRVLRLNRARFADFAKYLHDGAKPLHPPDRLGIGASQPLSRQPDCL